MVAIGDVVEVIDESIKGKVTKITAQGVCVETSEGLLLTFLPQELVKIDENASLHYHRMTGIAPKEEKNLYSVPADRPGLYFLHPSRDTIEHATH